MELDELNTHTDEQINDLTTKYNEAVEDKLHKQQQLRQLKIHSLFESLKGHINNNQYKANRQNNQLGTRHRTFRGERPYSPRPNSP